jgi:transposase
VGRSRRRTGCIWPGGLRSVSPGAVTSSSRWRGVPGWRYVAEELAAAEVLAHVAEAAGTAALRGRKRHVKTDKTDSRHLRQTLADGRLPECWIPPSHILECRALLELSRCARRAHHLGAAHHAVLFHQGVAQSGDLRTEQGRRSTWRNFR